MRLLYLAVIVMASPAAIAQEVVPLSQGQEAPFDGVLLDKEAAAEILAKEEMSEESCNVQAEYKVAKAVSECELYKGISDTKLETEISKNVEILSYESYTGKTIRFFSPEGADKSTSGRILERLNLLLREKRKEEPLKPSQFTKEVFLKRIDEENKYTLNTLKDERKVIP